MPHHAPDDLVQTLLYALLLALLLRTATLHSCVIIAAHVVVLLRTTVQVSGSSTGRGDASLRAGNRGRRASQGKKEDNSAKGHGRQSPDRDHPPKPPQSKPQPHPLTSPPPYSASPTPSPGKTPTPTATTILALYEDIIASDAQTIKVQQDTLAAQQDTIRAQARMIRELRVLLEAQEGVIEELEGRMGGAVGV